MAATSWLAPPGREERQRAAILEAVAAGVDWEAYLVLVGRHRTPALSWAALARVPEATPPGPVRKALGRADRAARLQAMALAGHLAGILEAFAQAGIPVMPLKGPLLSLRLYGDPHLRQAKDLDLMVPLEDLARGERMLLGLGWVPAGSGAKLTPRQWRAVVRHEHHLEFRHPGSGVNLELHWRNHDEGTVETRGRWERSSAAAWQEWPCRAMGPADLVLFLCSHGASHQWMRMKWLGDLARLHAEEAVDWEAVLALARAGRTVPALLQALRLLEILHGLPRPALPGDPWRNLPERLVTAPLHALADPLALGGPANVWRALKVRLAEAAYRRALLAHEPLRRRLADLVYCRPDYEVLRLPDALYWAYVPLRPLLWVYRRFLLSRRKFQGSRRAIGPAFRGEGGADGRRTEPRA
jgi:hypothetical protein